MSFIAKFTKQAICASFRKFLEQKPLEQITVKDIVDDCEINRKTFYYYYQDIYALLDDVFQMHLQEIKEKLPPEQHSLQEAMKVITGYLYDERRITSHVFKSLGYEKINDILFDSCMMYIPEFVKQSASGLSVCDGDLKLISTYCSITIAGLLTKWISQGMPDHSRGDDRPLFRNRKGLCPPVAGKRGRAEPTGRLTTAYPQKYGQITPSVTFFHTGREFDRVFLRPFALYCCQ